MKKGKRIIIIALLACVMLAACGKASASKEKDGWYKIPIKTGETDVFARVTYQGEKETPSNNDIYVNGKYAPTESVSNKETMSMAQYYTLPKNTETYVYVNPDFDWYNVIVSTYETDDEWSGDFNSKTFDNVIFYASENVDMIDLGYPCAAEAYMADN